MDAEIVLVTGAMAAGKSTVADLLARTLPRAATPPCGVTYRRSSGDGTFPLQATLTWKISWTGTGVNDEQPLPDGSFGAQQPVTVREVQAVNR